MYAHTCVCVRARVFVHSRYLELHECTLMYINGYRDIVSVHYLAYICMTLLHLFLQFYTYDSRRINHYISQTMIIFND